MQADPSPAEPPVGRSLKVTIMRQILYSVISVYVCVLAQSCLTLCDCMDCSLPDPLSGILHTRILERVAISSPGDLPNPGTEPESPASLALQADSLPTEPPGKPEN